MVINLNNDKNQNPNHLESPEGGEIRENTETQEETKKALSADNTPAGDTPADEVSADETPVKKPEPSKNVPAGAPKGARMAKVKRGGMTTLLTVVFIAIVVVVNILVTAMTDRFPSMNIDLTAQGLNTLSEQALEVAKDVQNETTIYFIGTEDEVRKDQIYSSYSAYGVKYSQVANLADKMQEANGKIKVSFIDPDTNPKFISDYAEENLTKGRVLIKTDKRYKVLTIDDLFKQQTDQTTQQTVFYSTADGALASAVNNVNLDTVPVVAVATGHDEMLSESTRSGFDSLLKNENFEVQEINFLTEAIPENTQVLMIPTPQTDYTEEEIQKIREFLNDQESQVSRSLLVTFHPSQAELPKLSSFLEEWGVQVQEGTVAETDSSRMYPGSASFVLADASEDILSDNTYSLILSAVTSPLKLLFSANDDIATYPLWLSSDSAYVLTGEETEETTPETSQQILATLSQRIVNRGDGTVEENVIVFGSSMSFTDSFVGTNTFSNRAYLTDLLRYVTDTDDTATVVTSEDKQTNSYDITMTTAQVTIFGMVIFTVILPIAILAAGLVIFLKRRHL